MPVYSSQFIPLQSVRHVFTNISGTAMSDRVRIKHLGLAAFIKMEGCKLVEVVDKVFIFETDIPLDGWRIKYNNSCCMRHDSLVCELRHFIK